MSTVRGSWLLFVSSLTLLVCLQGPRIDADATLETARVRRHLEGAEASLVSRDAATLSPTRRAARVRCIADLQAYIQRGVFPHNHQLSGRRTPVFVDEHGTRCAMAFLIERSGEVDLVARIAATRNLARIRELADDAELVAWLDRNGITLEEAARIQPAYGDVSNADDQDVAQWTASAVGLGVASTGVVLNRSIGVSQGVRNTRGLLGVVLGITGAGLGVSAISAEGPVRVLGAVDVAMGFASFALGIRQLNAVDGSAQAATRSITPAAWCDLQGTRRLGVVARF